MVCVSFCSVLGRCTITVLYFLTFLSLGALAKSHALTLQTPSNFGLKFSMFFEVFSRSPVKCTWSYLVILLSFVAWIWFQLLPVFFMFIPMITSRLEIATLQKCFSQLAFLSCFQSKDLEFKAFVRWVKMTKYYVLFFFRGN